MAAVINTSITMPPLLPIQSNQHLHHHPIPIPITNLSVALIQQLDLPTARGGGGRVLHHTEYGSGGDSLSKGGYLSVVEVL
jgi:hypothetical protein